MPLNSVRTQFLGLLVTRAANLGHNLEVHPDTSSDSLPVSIDQKTTAHSKISLLMPSPPLISPGVIRYSDRSQDPNWPRAEQAVKCSIARMNSEKPISRDSEVSYKTDTASADFLDCKPGGPVMDLYYWELLSLFLEEALGIEISDDDVTEWCIMTVRQIITSIYEKHLMSSEA